MNIDPVLFQNILYAVGLGLGVAFLFRLTRRISIARRLRFSILTGVLVVGLFMIVSASNLAGQESFLQILLALAVMFFANAGLHLFDAIVFEFFFERRRQRAVPRLVVDLFNFVALTIVALVVLSRIFGADLSGLLVTSTVLSAVIGLSLQDILSNVIAGLALQMEQTFRVGDWVHINQHDGQVVQMNWRTVTLQTRDHYHLVIPNSNMSRAEFINYSKPEATVRLRSSVGVHYQHPPEVVIDTFLDAIRQIDGVLANPEPEVVVTNYGDFAITYEIRYWVSDYLLEEQVRQAFMKRVWYALRRNSLAIPFPIRDINVRSVADDQAQAAINAERMQSEVFEVLRPLPLFEPLSDDQIYQLARGATLRRFTSGEVLVRQGDAGESLFVVKEGRVQVSVQGDSGPATVVATHGPGNFFGEMSLLTGEPRTASVTASIDTEVVVVDKSDVTTLVMADHSIAEALSNVIESRLRGTAEQIALEAEARSGKAAAQQSPLLNRIRSFFGIT
jgi:small-conductance mechanosensitive channel/CRP-like cAMP-binding protein